MDNIYVTIINTDIFYYVIMPQNLTNMELSIEYLFIDVSSRWDPHPYYEKKEPTGACDVTFTDDNDNTFYHRLLTKDVTEFMLKIHGIDLKKCYFKDGKLCHKSKKNIIKPYNILIKFIIIYV